MDYRKCLSPRRMALVAVLLLPFLTRAWGQNEQVLHRFTGGADPRKLWMTGTSVQPGDIPNGCSETWLTGSLPDGTDDCPSVRSAAVKSCACGAPLRGCGT